MKDNFVVSDGLRWINRGPSTDDHLSFGGHEPKLAPFLYGLARPDCVYVNVGAHVGTWALRMADKVSRVLAIEANAQTYDVLCRNIALNDLQDGVIPILAAVLDKDDVPLILTDVNGKETGGSTRVERPAFTRNFDILSKKLDTLLPFAVNSSRRIGLIQLDVEGAEAKVLAGARDILTHNRPNLLIELHEGHPGTDTDLRQQVYDILSQHDYTWHSLRVAGTEEHVIAMPSETPEYEGAVTINADH